MNHRITSNTWLNYDINFSQLRRITYLGIDTWGPSKIDAMRILETEYGNNYLIPDKKQPKYR